MLKRAFIITLGVFSLFYSTFSAAGLPTPLPEGIKGALCIVRVDNKLLLVNEILTGQISLPGGTISAGEPPHEAAQREVWEETGLVVTVGEALGYSDTAVFYDCVSDSPIVAYNTQHALGGNTLPIWFAPHYGVEIASAMLLEPTALKAEQYRFPQQWPLVREMFTRATNQPASYVRDLKEAAPSYRQIGLGWLAASQSWAAQSQVLSSIAMAVAHLAFYLTTPALLLVVMPLILWRFGRDFTLHALFAVTVTSLLALVAQQGFAMPRPHVYLPSTELLPSSGFSFPSASIAVWVCLTLLITTREGGKEWGKWAFAAIVLVALGEFYAGAEFLSDLLIGALLGALVAWHLLRLQQKAELDLGQLFASPLVWGALVAVAVGLTFIWPLPVFSAWLATLMLMPLLVLMWRKKACSLTQARALVLIVVLLTLNLLLTMLQSYFSSSGLYSYIVETLRYPSSLLAAMLLVLPLCKAREA
ncbi:bifunctional NUDIX hydrolase/phosphatase PAP2 family protein [Vibrio navarrensis]|uniref:bifunctional NUDIX hydrolase/phosphatase PAP2 family protein n=1 Tax=Vibrio navarrensis TaxID=29495 RepID=UPI001869DF00|nr:phosphatase PAP2 family protein [Vibrio navarrensis]MBE4588035.1 DNA mismatch repair protein MutT [Vibrio navarrensis]